MKLPVRVWSQLGPISVRHEPIAPEKDGGDPDMGRWDPGLREIIVNTATCDRTQLGTLFHEMTHVAMWDAGAQHNLTEQQQETICDAVGTYLAGAMLDGYLKFCFPKE